jgi:hypothetical protein
MTENEHTKPSAIDDMLADLGPDQTDERLRSALTNLRAEATEVPVASPDVVALLQGATPLQARSRQRMLAAAAAGALVFGGASAAAATNNLPDPIQEVVANVTGAPHPGDRPGVKPVKPTNAPSDAPGQLKDKSDHPHGDNSDAPGQIQKATKPDPSADGPAKPADPGSFGRARAEEVQASHDKGDNKKDTDKPAKPVKEKKAKKADHPAKPDLQDHQGHDDDDNGDGGRGGNRH